MTSAEIPPLPHKTLRSQVFAGTPIQEMDSGKCRDKCTFYASVAQSVEQGTENPRVIGSIPIGGTSQETQQGFQYAAVAHLVERHLAKVEVASSSLVGRSIMEQQSLFQYGPVAQLVRAPACHAGGRRFEPDPGRFVESSAVHRAVLQAKLL